MPVFGKEEPGKNNAGEGVPIKKRRFPVLNKDEQSSNNDEGAGVPIKKRGFPVLSPPSPTPTLQESSSISARNDSFGIKNLGTGQESSVMDATIASKSVGKFDGSKNPLAEVKKEIVSTGSNVNFPNLATRSDVDVKSQQVSVKCKPEPFASTGPLVQALTGQNNEVSQSKEDCVDRSKNVDKTVNHDNVVSANRSNWDLNTTMDAWGGSCGDAHQLDTVGSNESNKIAGSHLEVGVNVDLGKHNLGDGDVRTEFPISSLPSTQYRAEDMLHLSLSPSFTRTNFSTEPNMPSCSSATMPFASLATLASDSSANIPSGSLARVDSDSVMAVNYSKLLGQLETTKNSTAGINVKPEPSDGIAKHDSVAAKVNSVGFKHDLSNMPSVSSASIAFGSSASMNSGLSAVDYSEVLGQDLVAAKVNLVGSLTIVKKEVVERCGKIDFAAPNAISPNVGEERPIKPEPTPILTESIVNTSAGTVLQSQDIINSCSTVLPSSSDVSNQEHSASKNAAIPVQGRNNSNMCGAEDSNVFESDDEKLDISTDMIEEDSYGSDSESDGHATKRTRGGKEEEDFEDGEIRESLLRNTTLVVATNNGDCENSNLSNLGLTDNVNLNQNLVEDKDHIKECDDANVEERSDQILDKGVTVQEPLAVEAGPAVAETEIFSLSETQRRLDRTEELCDGGDKVMETETIVGEIQNENEKREIDDFCLPTTDSSLNAQQDGARDTDSGSGGGRSRIITLPRASNVVSPSKTRSILESPFEWETRKERCTDFEEDELHLQRNRDEMFTDGPRRFVRDRFQDQSFRGRTEFNRGRGRAYNRFDRSEWVSSGRKFNPDNYSGEYRLSRNKHISASDEELESNNYPLAQDGDLVASGRGGRKPLNDDFPSFRNTASRRLSPRGRSPTSRGVQVVRRVARNISPNGDKYNINFPEDDVEPMFTRYQNSNEGIDDQFPRNNRKFSFVQRRDIPPPRVRSKSPMRSRTRSSLGPWSSPPRRRSPDGYNPIQELPRQQRSPHVYRMERVRSPPLNFPDEIVPRRRGSPPYIARHSNDFQRPIMSNRRSPPDRPIPRNNRRFDNPLDLAERTNSGKYYEGPIRSSRFDEIEEEGTGDDRRRLNERRGGRGFNGENFRFRQDSGGPRPLRFAPKGNSEFIERNNNNNNNNNNNLREREFDRRIKNRPVIAPSRRIRAVEDQEGDFRQGGPVWHDDGFGDASRGKRRRF